MGIHWSSLSQIICEDLPLKCLKWCRAQELTDANCAVAWSTLSFCFKSSCSMPLTLFSLRTKRCSRSLHLTIGRTKSVGDCKNFWRRGLAFSSVRALRSLPLPGHMSTVPVSRNFYNSLLTPCFVRLFSENSSINLYAVYPFKYKLFLSKSCPRRWMSCSLLTNTAVMSAVTNFWCHKLIAKVNKWKDTDMENFICSQYGERLNMLNTKNIKICGWITKLQAIKIQYCLCFLPHLQKIWIFTFPR